MDQITDFVTSLAPSSDGDPVDLLNGYVTPVLLVFFSLFISGWSFVGEPIQCWFPAYYNGWWIEYALDYCFVQNTYFVPLTTKPATNFWELNEFRTEIGVGNELDKQHREEKIIGYYQWVPFILALEALCFYLPVMLWRNLYEASGLKVRTICETLASSENMTAEERESSIKTISRFVDRCLELGDRVHGKRSFFGGRYVSSLYIFIKLLFALNCVAQFFMLQLFLGLDNFWWGATVLVNLITGREWQETGHFPRVTMCDYSVKVLGNLHNHTVQCVLMINMFNEKIFMFLWWWFALVAVLSIVSFVYWLVTILTPRTGESMIEEFLKHIDENTASLNKPRRQQLVQRFMRETLKPDGIFLVRLTAVNAGDVVVSELIEALWTRYKNRPGNSSAHPAPPSATMPSAPYIVDDNTLPMTTIKEKASEESIGSSDTPRRYAYPPAYDAPDEHKL